MFKGFSGLYRLFRYWSETPKQTKKKFFGFAKQTEKQSKQIDFRFVSVRTEKKIWLFRGHPSFRLFAVEAQIFMSLFSRSANVSNRFHRSGNVSKSFHSEPKCFKLFSVEAKMFPIFKCFKLFSVKAQLFQNVFCRSKNISNCV